MITYYTGRTRAVREAVFERLKALLAEGEHPVNLIVPAQYTLEAELDAVDLLNLEGSFRLQVLSPARLCQRVFEAAGRPARVSVNDQGRVMLLQKAATRLSGEMGWYRGATRRPGFAERAMRQIEYFKQAGLSPEEVRTLSARKTGALSAKLLDISTLYEAYEQALAGRFLDGEDEVREAILRFPDAAITRGDMLFYGFDMISPTLARIIAALCGCARSVSLFLTLENDGNKRDFSIFEPVQYAYERLHRQILALDIPWARVRLKDAEDGVRPPDLCHLARELYCWPPAAYSKPPEAVRVLSLANPEDEAEYAAAMARHLARTRGIRYRDITVACQSLSETMIFALTRAFALYDVPIFLSQSRTADKHPLSRCLLSALRLVSMNLQPEDMADYIRSGFAPIEDDEADLLMNYAQAFGLKGRAWLRPLTRGEPEEVAFLEPVRRRLMEPVEALRRRIAKKAPAAEILEAAFLFLEDIGARARLEARQTRLTEMGRREWAMEGAQVWNKLIGALDQAHEILEGETLTARELYELLRRALGAAEVKALPQSGDAVTGGGLDHMKGRPVRVLFILGVTDTAPSEGGALLGEKELSALSSLGIWLGMSAEERSSMLRLGVKNALDLTEESVFITAPRSDMAGAAQKSGMLIGQVHRILPRLREQGGVTGTAEKRLRLMAPAAALARSGAFLRENPQDLDALNALAVLSEIPEYQPSVALLERAFAHRVESEPLPEPLRSIPKELSATRLERFYACPFKDFVANVLRPFENPVFELTPREIGRFYHGALERFTRENGAALSTMDGEEAARRMDLVTAELMKSLAERTIGDSAVAEREGARILETARRAARTVARHLEDSRFHPIALEVEFGRDEARILLGESALYGHIDRVDAWADGGEKYLRVLDYKTGGRSVSLQEVYYGLQLQLVLYLAAAVKKGGKPAGVFYFTIADPLIGTESRDPEEIEALRAKELSLDGLTLDDERVVEAMSPDSERVLDIRRTEKGLKGGRLVEAEDFDVLIRHAIRRADDALLRIRSGETAIRPAKLGSAYNACDTCDFAAVCQFTPGLPGANARKLSKLKSSEVLERMRADLNVDPG